MKKLTKKNITKLFIQIQNEGDIVANSIVTKAVKEFGLEKEHQRQTKNPPMSYKI